MVESKELIDEVRAWVDRMNELPLTYLEILMEARPESWYNATGIKNWDRIETEIPCPVTDSYGDAVDEDIVEDHKDGFTGAVIDVNMEKKVYLVSMDDLDREKSCVVDVPFGDAALLDREEWPYPTWNCLWSFKDRLSDEWIEKHTAEVSALGFIIFENSEEGFYLGLDEGGFDFVSTFFKDLYLLMHGEYRETECG